MIGIASLVAASETDDPARPQPLSLPILAMKSITISPISLVLGALLTLGLFLVMGQAGPSSFGTWGPPKKGVVNIFRAPGSSIPSGGVFVAYQVPNDRWLTITGVQAGTAGCPCSVGPQGSAPCLVWAEQLSGVVVEKGHVANVGSSGGLNTNPGLAGSALGWVFRPGSQVVIRNNDVAPCSVYDFSLIGYETRD